MASGAAPLSADLQNWVTVRATACLDPSLLCSSSRSFSRQTVFNAPVLQGYGMTENSGAAVAQNKGTKSHQGSVGGPLPCIEVKLVDTDDYKVI
jgi:acyl-coenzyme A synthetase/AMP-(fatty) acid ligase